MCFKEKNPAAFYAGIFRDGSKLSYIDYFIIAEDDNYAGNKMSKLW